MSNVLSNCSRPDMKICIDSDVAGRTLKSWLAYELRFMGFNVRELDESGAYPEVAFNLARCVGMHEYERGILVCRTGMGMAMAANKMRGVFAAVCRTATDATELASSKAGNVMAIGCGVTDQITALTLCLTFLQTPIDVRPNAQRMRDLEE